MALDLRFQRFTHLVAIRRDPDRPRNWIVYCDCGSRTSVRTSNLTSGQTGSCGCLRAGVTPTASGNPVWPYIAKRVDLAQLSTEHHDRLIKLLQYEVADEVLAVALLVGRSLPSPTVTPASPATKLSTKQSDPRPNSETGG